MAEKNSPPPYRSHIKECAETPIDRIWVFSLCCNPPVFRHPYGLRPAIRERKSLGISKLFDEFPNLLWCGFISFSTANLVILFWPSKYPGNKKVSISWDFFYYFPRSELGVLNLLYDSLESSRIVNCEVSKDLAVDFDSRFVDKTHQLRVWQIF